jgi:hypothetical protein
MHAVIQTPGFLSDCRSAGLSDDEVTTIVAAIAADPEAGDLIPGTGGARKRRFAGRGKGKSGGYRTVTYFGGRDVPVVALAVINKGQRANISAADREVLRKELAGFADDYRAGVRKRVTEMKRRRL